MEGWERKGEGPTGATSMFCPGAPEFLVTRLIGAPAWWLLVPSGACAMAVTWGKLFHYNVAMRNVLIRIFLI